MEAGGKRLGVAVAALLVAGGLAAATSSTSDGRGPRALAVASDRRAEAREPRPGPMRISAAPTDGRVRAAGAGEPVIAELVRHDSCAALADELKARALPLVTAWGLPYGSAGALVADVAAGSSAGSASAGSGGSPTPTPSSPSFSTTNVQEAGVDEPDLVKNDGDRLFTLYNDQLRSVELDGDQPMIRDSLGITNGRELLLAGDRALVIGNDYTDRATTRVTVVDVRDVANLEVVDELSVDGWYVSAREVDGTVRLVVSGALPRLPFVQPQTADAEAQALAHNRRVVLESDIGGWLPAGTSCDDVYTPRQFAGLASTTVLTIDPARAEAIDAVTVVGDAGEIYASASHLYVASWPYIPAADGSIAPEATHIHRFDISDASRTTYEASGVVPGHLLRPFAWGGGHMGQWSMSEHDDVLRVATTVGQRWDQTAASQSSVTTLRVQDGVLVPVGTVTGLGIGERIYAVRFMGPVGYVVTYRVTDPLYVVDLADPAAPRVAGELKIPGYSAYLHPVGDGRLLGVGQGDADEDGAVDGTQVSLFDVSDPTSPRRVAHLEIGERGTVSAVEHDHRAFTWWDDPARAVLPVMGAFNGAVAIGVYGDSLVEAGRVAHTGDDTWCVGMDRTRVLGGRVLTFSAAGIGVHDLDDLERRSELTYDGVEGWCGAPPPTTTSTTSTTTTTTTVVPLGAR